MEGVTRIHLATNLTGRLQLQNFWEIHPVVTVRGSDIVIFSPQLYVQGTLRLSTLQAKFSTFEVRVPDILTVLFFLLA